MALVLERRSVTINCLFSGYTMVLVYGNYTLPVAPSKIIFHVCIEIILNSTHGTFNSLQLFKSNDTEQLSIAKKNSLS